MRELSLFTGGGGGILGTSIMGWQLVGCVEWEGYCQRILRQRMEDGLIETAPIFSDIRAFINEGYARSYKGMVDVITAGFPCQPFSVAGKRAGADDERNMWPATIECIRMVRPRYAFLENVSGLLTSGYFGQILRDLVESGYDCRWRVLSAAEVGAPHKRDRLWILAYSNCERESTGCGKIQEAHGEISERYNDAKSDNSGHGGGQKDTDVSYPDLSGSRASRRDIDKQGSEVRQERQDKSQYEFSRHGKNVADTTSKRQQGQRWPINALYTAKESEGERDNFISDTGWSVEPDVGRVANGVASRVDRLKALGNGQVPQCVAKAWELLSTS